MSAPVAESSATLPAPRRRFGQNFLHDPQVIQRIVDHIDPAHTDHLVEIGPGRGALTRPLLASGATLDAVELDRDLAALLHRELGTSPAFRLHQADALVFDFTGLAQGPRSLRVVGNLPYNISTPLLFRLLPLAPLIRDMVFMLQREVVERLAAGPGDDAYGRLSVMVNYHCRVEPLFDVPPGAFTPRPQVMSAIVQLIPHDPLPAPVRDLQALETVVRAAFNQRRKTLRNSLRGIIPADGLSALGIDPGARAETLSVADFACIADALTPA